MLKNKLGVGEEEERMAHKAALHTLLMFFMLCNKSNLCCLPRANELEEQRYHPFDFEEEHKARRYS